jgi:Fe-S oxidoreductase
VMIEHVDKIVDLRRNLVMMEGSMPAELQTTMRNWETQSNPWGMAPDMRDEWARALNIPRYAEKPDVEYLYYVGCAGSFNDRNKKTTIAFAKILQKAGISFAILGKEELCNGETARRAGNEFLAKTMIDANIAVLKQHNVKKVLTTCPHCFNTIKNEYPDFGFAAEKVYHHTEFIDLLITQGKLIPQKGHGEDRVRVTFHDSCYLGRYNEVYEQPRHALTAMGADLVEMPRSKSKGFCCGAGGARMWMEETIGKRINVERVEEALEQKPSVIAAGCPFCQVMLNDGVHTKGEETKVKVVDVAEFVAERAGL